MIKILKKARNSNLFKDSVWAILSNILSKGLGLFSGIIVARLLGSEFFGQFGILKNTLLTFSIFASFGLGYSSTKFVSQYVKDNKSSVKYIARKFQMSSLVIGLICYLLFFSFAGDVSQVIFENGEMKLYLRIFGFFIVINSFNITQNGIIAGLKSFKELTKIGFIVGVFSFIITVFLSYYFGLFGALTSYVLSQLLNVFLNFKLINSWGGADSKQLLQEGFENFISFRSIAVFTMPIAIQEVIYSVSSWILSMVILKFGSFHEVGVFSAANQWTVILLFIPAVLRNVVLSHFSSNIGDRKKNRGILLRVLSFNFLVTILPYLFVLLFSNLVVGFYGSTFHDLENVLPILLLSTVFVSLSNVYTQAFLSESRNFEVMIIRIFRDIGIPLTCWLILSGEMLEMIPLVIVSGCILVFNLISFVLMVLLFHVNPIYK